jgi:hypothetical protein
VETIVAVEMMIAIIAATVKNIPAEEVGEWWRIADAVVWFAEAASTQVGGKRSLVSRYKTQS